MALARWQATIVDESGNVVPGASVEVRSEAPGAPLVSLYADRDGETPLSNPFAADADGFAAFHVAGGAYKVRAAKAGFERVWRYVSIGTNAERDFGALLNPRGAWAVGTTYAMGDVVSHQDGASDVYAFISNAGSNVGHEPAFSSDVPQSDTYWTVIGVAPGYGGNVSSTTVFNIEKLTQTEYDEIETPDVATLYVIVEE
jgi:hypothetical protein